MTVRSLYRPTDYVGVQEAAEEIGCSRQSVYRLLDAGRLEGARPLGTWRKVKRASLAQFLGRITRSHVSSPIRARERGAPKRGRA